MKSVWSAIKDKVNQAVEATKDAYASLKEYGNDKVDQIENWSDSKKKSFGKTIMAWAVKNWGEDEVKSWI